MWQLCGQCHVDRRAAPAPQVPDGQLQDRGLPEQEVALLAPGQGQALGAEQQ